MIEGIPLALSQVGPWGLLIVMVALVVVAFIKGWIVPVTVLQAWIKIGETERARADRAMELLSEAQEGNRTAVAAIQGLKDVVARREQEAGDRL